MDLNGFHLRHQLRADQKVIQAPAIVKGMGYRESAKMTCQKSLHPAKGARGRLLHFRPPQAIKFNQKGFP
jgi:hypothetical protein